jgi:hypothetical protein
VAGGIFPSDEREHPEKALREAIVNALVHRTAGHLEREGCAKERSAGNTAHERQFRMGMASSPLGRMHDRHAERAVDAALLDSRVVLVNGARQSGKSPLQASRIDDGLSALRRSRTLLYSQADLGGDALRRHVRSPG